MEFLFGDTPFPRICAHPRPFQTLRFVLMPPESDEGIKGVTKKRQLERSEGYSFVRL